MHRRLIVLGEDWSLNLSASQRGGLICAALLLYGLAFHVLFLFAGVFEISGTNSSIWYPPAGLRLAALLIFGWRFGVLIFCIEAVYGLAIGMPEAWGLTGARASDLPRIASLVATIAIPPACYAMAAFFLERRKRPDAGADPFTGILYFLFIVCLAAAANGILGSLNLIIIGHLSWQEFHAGAGGRAIGDLIGILTLTPALLLAASHLENRWRMFSSRSVRMTWLSGTTPAASDPPAMRTLIEGAAVCFLVFAALLAAGEHPRTSITPAPPTDTRSSFRSSGSRCALGCLPPLSERFA